MGYFEKHYSLIKNYFDYFLATFRENWAILILTSGHTETASFASPQVCPFFPFFFFKTMSQCHKQILAQLNYAVMIECSKSNDNFNQSDCNMLAQHSYTLLKLVHVIRIKYFKTFLHWATVVVQWPACSRSNLTIQVQVPLNVIFVVIEKTDETVWSF